MSELGKPFQNKLDKKTENQCQSAACEQKNQYREREILFKLKTRPKMNYELIEKTFGKKIQ